MDKRPLRQLNLAASELSLADLAPTTTSSIGGCSPIAINAAVTNHDYYCGHDMGRNMYQEPQLTPVFSNDPAVYPNSSMPQNWDMAQMPQQGPAPTAQQSVTHDYVPLAERPSISASVASGMSDGEDPNDGSMHDEAGERRRERRRTQNRAAQRAFRARKEETIKESSSRLDALQLELSHLQTGNRDLSETVSALRAQILALENENQQLKQNGAGNIDWEALESSFIDSVQKPAASTRPALTTGSSNDSEAFDMASNRSFTSPGQGSSSSSLPMTEDQGGESGRVLHGSRRNMSKTERLPKNP